MFVWRISGGGSSGDASSSGEPGGGGSGMQLAVAATWKVPACSSAGGWGSRCQFGATADGRYISVVRALPAARTRWRRWWGCCCCCCACCCACCCLPSPEGAACCRSRPQHLRLAPHPTAAGKQQGRLLRLRQRQRGARGARQRHPRVWWVGGATLLGWGAQAVAGWGAAKRGVCTAGTATLRGEHWQQRPLNSTAGTPLPDWHAARPLPPPAAPVRACGLSEDCRHLMAVLGKGFVFRWGRSLGYRVRKRAGRRKWGRRPLRRRQGQGRRRLRATA